MVTKLKYLTDNGDTFEIGNGLRKETEIVLETNFKSFIFLFLFYHSKMLLLVILFVSVRLYVIFDHSPIDGIFDHSPIAPRHLVTKALKSPTSTTVLREHLV